MSAFSRKKLFYVQQVTCVALSRRARVVTLGSYTDTDNIAIRIIFTS